MNILDKTKKYDFAKSVALLAGGTITSQLIVIAATPFLTRIYTPEDFGVLATFAAILIILGVVSSFRYELAIPLPKSNKDAIKILTLCLHLVILFTLVTVTIIFLFYDKLQTWIKNPQLTEYLWLLPIGLFSFGIYNVCSHWSIRNKNFKTIASTKIGQAFGMIICQLGIFKLGAPGLVIGHTAGQTIGAMSLGLIEIKRNWGLIAQVKKTQLIQVAKEYYRFPLYSTWATLIHTFSSQAPNLLFAYLFSPFTAGLFFLANRITNAPLSLLGSAIGQTFLSRAREANHNNTLKLLAIKIVVKLIFIISPIVIIIAFWADDIFALVFGESWRNAGEMAQWLTPMIAMQFITSPVSQLLAIQGKQHIHLLLIIVFALLRLLSFYIGSYYSDIMITVILFSILSSIGYAMFLATSLLHMVKNKK